MTAARTELHPTLLCHCSATATNSDATDDGPAKERVLAFMCMAEGLLRQLLAMEKQTATNSRSGVAWCLVVYGLSPASASRNWPSLSRSTLRSARINMHGSRRADHGHVGLCHSSPLFLCPSSSPKHKPVAVHPSGHSTAVIDVQQDTAAQLSVQVRPELADADGGLVVPYRDGTEDDIEEAWL